MTISFEKSKALYEVGKDVLAGGVSSNFRYGGYGESPVPLYYAKGEGSRLTDVDGNEYIDYALANGPNILGHAPEVVLKAVADSLAIGQLFAGQTESEAILARHLVDIIPCAERIRFASSGTEAVQAVIRLARAHTGRKKMIKFEGHYHGWADNIFASINPSFNEAGPAEDPIPVGHTPGQASNVLEDLIVLPWNDLEQFAQTLREHGDDIAGVIMEPIMCNTGTIPPKPGYLEGVREITTQHGAVLIFDEVVTGFRVGLTGAQGLFGVTPDLAVFAKAVAAGFPLAVIAGRRDVMELVQTSQVMHGGTYNANLMSIAAGLATVEELAKNDGQAYRDMTARGERLIDGLRKIASDQNQPLLIQGVGSVFHPAFTNRAVIENYRQFTEVDAEKQATFGAKLQSAGVRVSARGTWLMSTAHTDDDIDETLIAAKEAMNHV